MIILHSSQDPQRPSSQITSRTLRWYKAHKRDLPWRRTQNPYFIWIAEVMLQQTQVETVIPYYHRFLARFPDVEALADAPLQDVLKVWENMGYYGRARHLHAAAREIVDEKGGEIPRTWEELIRLPGVGAYTAGAILSFAFGERVPAVDGNAGRILCRLFLIQEPLDRVQTRRRTFELAASLVPRRAPGSFNQALMDLGSAVCRPRNPSCSTCPLRRLCLAFSEGAQDALPVRKKRKPLPQKEMTAAIIRDRRGRQLIVERPPSGLLGGLWKFPGGEKRSKETTEEALRRTVKEETGMGVRVGQPIATVEHAYSHFRMTLQAFRCSRQTAHSRGPSHRLKWVSPRSLSKLPFSRADQKVIEALGI
jgi:A/G-specific adenine glycosylase